MEEQFNVAPKSEWLGVEVVSEGTRTQSNARLAMGSCILLGGFLLIVQVVLPILMSGGYSRFEYLDPRFFWPLFLALLVIDWEVVFLNSQRFTGATGKIVTLNTEVGPANAGELLGAFVRVTGTLYPTAYSDLIKGRLAVSNRGIAGIVTITWKSISSMSAVSKNTVQIRKTGLLPLLSRVLGLDSLSLRFADSSDAAQFLASARVFLAGRVD